MLGSFIKAVYILFFKQFPPIILIKILSVAVLQELDVKLICKKKLIHENTIILSFLYAMMTIIALKKKIEIR